MKSTDLGKPLKIYLAVLMLTSALFSSSCGSSKKATQITDKSEVSQSFRTAEADSVKREQVATMVEDNRTDIEMVTRWVIYDTARGDTTTTKPPILAEGCTEQRSRSASRREVETNDTQKVATSRNIESERNEQTDIETEEQRETQAGADGFDKLALLMLVAVGVGVVYLVKRKKSN